LTADSGYEGKIIPRWIRLSTFIKVINEENIGHDSDINRELTLAPLRETESTTVQIVELLRHRDQNGNEQIRSRFYVQNLLTQNNQSTENRRLTLFVTTS